MNNDVTVILQAINRGEPDAAEQLLSVVYGELRRLASAKLAHERNGYTLQSTDLVNEMYLRLFGDASPDRHSDADQQGGPNQMSGDDSDARVQWNSRRHFFGAAAQAMRRILIERARSRQTLKRGGDRNRVDFDLAEIEAEAPSIDMLALDLALSRLEQVDPQKADVVKLRYFAGLTIEQTAKALELSEPTVKRHWSYSRVWLKREMSELDSKKPS